MSDGGAAPDRPDFLIVGAMKAGTTTLYHDLSAHPDIFLPTFKEPEILVACDDPAEIRREYAALFRPARPDQIKGEASTAYTKRPTHEGVAEKAKALGGALRIIYIRRDPMARIQSQFQHERQHGQIVEPFDVAIRQHDRLIDYSRYDWQIAPWLAAFGPDNVLQLDLESYAAGRVETLDRVLRFIGADPGRLPAIDTSAVSNRREEAKTISNPLLDGFVRSGFYQRVVKRFIPRRMRETARRAMLPAPEIADAELTPSIVSYIRRRLAASPAEKTQ